MTQSQIREGCRRIGVVLGCIVAVATAVFVVAVTQPGAPGGSWWITAKWIAITAPVAWWCGSRVANLCGWIVAGFFPPGSEVEPQDAVEAAKAALLKHAAAKEGPGFAAVLQARWSLEPYFTYIAWALAWIAADQAERILFYLPSGSAFLWPARSVAGVGTFIVLIIVFIVGSALIADSVARKFCDKRPTSGSA